MEKKNEIQNSWHNNAFVWIEPSVMSAENRFQDQGKKLLVTFSITGRMMYFILSSLFMMLLEPGFLYKIFVARTTSFTLYYVFMYKILGNCVAVM